MHILRITLFLIMQWWRFVYASADAHRGQTSLIPWQPEIQVAVMSSVGAGNRTWVLCNSKTQLLSQPPMCIV